MRKVYLKEGIFTLFICLIVFAKADGQFSSRSSKKKQTIHLYMNQLCCNKTTESGADEVYILVMAQRSDGTKYFQRVPGPDYHWDMNDGDQPTDNPDGDSHCITNRLLFSGDIEEGQTWWFNIVIAEEDGGTSKDYQEKAAEVLISTGDPYAAGAGTVIKALTDFGFSITDSDDWIGMCGIRVTYETFEQNEERQVKKHPFGFRVTVGKVGDLPEEVFTEWTSKEFAVEDAQYLDDLDRTKKFTMNHDGSNYMGIFIVK